MDNMVNNMSQNDKTADATCVFRVPSSDVTVPDLMANVRITAPVLSIVKGPQTGAAFVLEHQVTTTGRDPANAIFLNHITASRSHARIIREGLGARIEDLGSLIFNGAATTEIYTLSLHDGSSVQIGTFTLIYHESTPERIETGE